MNAEVSLQHADCLRSTSEFGNTIVRNICNGSVVDVPWGTLDWVLCFGLMAFAFAFITMLIAMGFRTIFDW